MANPFVIIGGIAVAGWAARQIAGMFEEASGATKWAVAAGGIYVSYQALKATGALK